MSGVKCLSTAEIASPTGETACSCGTHFLSLPQHPFGRGHGCWENGMSDVWPTELRVSKDRRTLHVSFSDGTVYGLPAEMMRVLSPSAEVQGHGPGQKVTVPGKRNVMIVSITPAGHYAVRIGFDDGHGSGIFTWPYLRELGQDGEGMFADYLRELAIKGLSREN